MSRILNWVTEEDKIGIQDNEILDQWEVPFGAWIDQMVDWIDANLVWLLDAIKWPFEFLLRNFVDNFLIEWLPWWGAVLLIFVIGCLVRSISVGVTAGLALALCGLLGADYWVESIRTIGMVLVAVVLCALIGIPLGILCGRVDSAWNAVRPILDAMQVVHAFVYMLPIIFFFSIGVVPATMVTMIFAIPPLIRLTNLGIRQVPEDVVEASRAYGATELRVLTDVQLPLARPALMAGLNQTLLLSISMLGIAAIMGAGGLGRLVYKSVQNLSVSQAASSGLALFIVAVVLDRLSQPEESDTGNLFSRIRKAWATRSTPEDLLKEVQESAAEKPSEKKEDEYKQLTPQERIGYAAAGVGGIVALISTFLTWGKDSGLLSGHSRTTDLDLTGQSFTGLQASGGSWAGYVVFGLSVFLILAAVSSFRKAGSGNRWFSPDGVVIASIAMLIVTLTYLLVNNAVGTVSYSHGIGIYLALASSIVMVLGGVYALWTAPYSALRPLSLTVSWSRILTAVTAVLFIYIGSIAGWTFDERGSGQLSSAQEEEVAALKAECDADASTCPLNTLAIGSIYNDARLSNKIIRDGYTEEGGGLGYLSIIGIAAAALFVLPAAGLFRKEEHYRWRWTTLAAGTGLGVSLIGLVWIASLLRVSETLIVTGNGAFLVLTAGYILFSSSKKLLDEFRREMDYDDSAAAGAESEADQVALSET